MHTVYLLVRVALPPCIAVSLPSRVTDPSCVAVPPRARRMLAPCVLLAPRASLVAGPFLSHIIGSSCVAGHSPSHVAGPLCIAGALLTSCELLPLVRRWPLMHCRGVVEVYTCLGHVLTSNYLIILQEYLCDLSL